MPRPCPCEIAVADRKKRQCGLGPQSLHAHYRPAWKRSQALGFDDARVSRSISSRLVQRVERPCASVVAWPSALAPRRRSAGRSASPRTVAPRRSGSTGPDPRRLRPPAPRKGNPSGRARTRRGTGDRPSPQTTRRRCSGSPSPGCQLSIAPRSPLRGVPARLTCPMRMSLWGISVARAATCESVISHVGRFTIQARTTLDKGVADSPRRSGARP